MYGPASLVSSLVSSLVHCFRAVQEPGGQGAVFGDGQPACLLRPPTLQPISTAPRRCGKGEGLGSVRREDE